MVTHLINAAKLRGRLALPGHYAIAMRQDASHTYYMTATGGGGHTTDAIHTDATVVKDWEKFRVIGGADEPTFAIMTFNGHFLTAQNGGGLIINAIRTNENSVNAWELFGLKLQPEAGPYPHFSIQTSSGFFLAAVDRGGVNSGDVIHTDGKVVSDWELFDFLKIGDLGPTSTYVFEGLDGSGKTIGFLNATDGGRHSETTALTPQLGPQYTLAFTVIRQSDGSYALKTSSGYYVTANAGGLPGKGYRTDTPQVNNWEKFTLVANENDCTSLIKTHSGTYLSIVMANTGMGHHGGAQPLIIDSVADAAHATRWRLWVVDFFA